jgi:hypothetical protein
MIILRILTIKRDYTVSSETCIMKLLTIFGLDNNSDLRYSCSPSKVLYIVFIILDNETATLLNNC